MSRIERIDLYHINVPLKQPFWPSWIPGYPQTHVRFTLMKLTTSDGIIGWSAGNAFTSERQGLGDLLGGFILGMRADDLENVRKRIREASYLGWRNSWIENAFWDLKGKMEGKPVYKLLQKTEETVEKAPIYASTGTLKTFEERKPYLDEIREKGIKAIKIRVHDPHMNLENDTRILRECRKELGDDFVMGVDANQGWPVSLIEPTAIWTLDYATQFGKVCDELGLAWLEEPLDMHDWEGMAELRKRLKTPVSGAELLSGWHELKALFERECLDYYQPDVSFSGLTTAVNVMDACRERGLKFSPHTWSNGLGFMQNIHAFAAWEHRKLLEYPYEPPGWVPAQREGIIPPIEVNPDGTVDVPQEPGLGINIDPGLLRRYGTKFYSVTPFRLALRTVREKGLKEALELKKKKEAAAGQG